MDYGLGFAMLAKLGGGHIAFIEKDAQSSNRKLTKRHYVFLNF
jgi:hypothetical protein